MANVMDATFTIERELRPCLIDGRFKALWHNWTERPARGREGDVAVCVALVEWEDGSVDYVIPTRVQFLDTKCKMDKVEGAFIFAEERHLIKKKEE